MASDVCSRIVSTLCDKQPGGVIKCHNDYINLFTEGDKTQNALQKQSMVVNCEEPAKGHRQSASSTSKVKKEFSSDTLASQKTKNKNWLCGQALRYLQDKCDSDSRRTRDAFMKILDTENTFVKDVHNFTEYQTMLRQRRRELLHKQWADNVYEPLRKKIIEEMDGINWRELDRRKRELHKQFLEYRNKKGVIFLDTVDPADYYGMALNGYRPAPLKAETKRLNDPLHAERLQRCDEDRAVIRCITRHSRFTDKDMDKFRRPLPPLVPLGRDDTGCAAWVTMALGDIESYQRIASRRRMTGAASSTTMARDQWSERGHTEHPVETQRGSPSDQTSSSQHTTTSVAPEIICPDLTSRSKLERDVESNIDTDATLAMSKSSVAADVSQGSYQIGLLDNQPSSHNIPAGTVKIHSHPFYKPTVESKFNKVYASDPVLNS